MGIRRFVVGRLFMGRADGFAPVIRAEGVDVFALGEVQGLDEGLAEIGEGGGGFGFHLALGDGGEEASQGGAEIAGGHVAARKVVGDILASPLASEGLGLLAGVERTEVRMTVAPGNAAVAAIDKHERTQSGTVVLTCDRPDFIGVNAAVDGAIGGHGSLQKERFGILGESREGEAHYRTRKVYQSDNYSVKKILERIRLNCKAIEMNEKLPESVFRPAKIDEGVIEPGEGETDDIEVATLDARNEAPGVALNGVGAGFVMRFAGGEVAEDLLAGQRGEMDERGFDKSTGLCVGEADKRDPGDDGVGAAGKFFKHLTRIVRRAGLSEDKAVDRDDRIRRDDDRRADSARGYELGFCFGEALDVHVRRFAGEGSLVHRGRKNNERETRLAEDFGAARGGGSKDQLHGDISLGKNTTERLMKQLAQAERREKKD